MFIYYPLTMTEAEVTQIQNEVFTKLVIDLLKEQRANGIAPDKYCLDKYEVDRLTQEKVKKLILEGRK